MKKILLLGLLLIPLFCNGQTKESDKKVYKFYIEEYIDHYGNTVIVDSIDLIPLRTFQLYQKECYNDSTFINDRYIDGIGENGRSYYTTILAHYIHKTPTFEGFLKYLEEQ